MMVYNTQNHWVCKLCPSSEIVNTRKHNVSETESFSVLRWGEGDTYSVGSLRKSQPQLLDLVLSNHWIECSNRVVVPLPSPEDGNRSSSQNICFLVIQNSGTMDKVHKPTISKNIWIGVRTTYRKLECGLDSAGWEEFIVGRSNLWTSECTYIFYRIRRFLDQLSNYPPLMKECAPRY
jgi:hypothetical protein